MFQSDEQRREAERERRVYKWKVGLGWWSAVVFSLLELQGQDK